MVEEDKDADADAGADIDMVSEITPRIRPYVPPTIQIPVVPVPLELPLALPSGQDIYAGIRLLTPAENTIPYPRPSVSSHHAYHIWQQAGLPNYAVERFLEIKLIDWASHYAQLEIVGHDIVSVRYQTPTDCLYFCSWRVFLRWMMCACFPR